MTRHDPRNEPEQAGRGPARFNDSPTETIDVSRIHMRIVSQEQIEPEEGLERPPWWLWSFSVLLLFAMGFYIGRYGGSFSAAAHEVEEPPVARTDRQQPRKSKGDQVFSGVCQPCHQAHGYGIPGQYPPLAGSEWLLGRPRDSDTNSAARPFGTDRRQRDVPITTGCLPFRTSSPMKKLPLLYHVGAITMGEQRSACDSRGSGLDPAEDRWPWRVVSSRTSETAGSQTIPKMTLQ